MLGALLDLSMGRIEDAVAAFVLNWERAEGAPLGEAQLRFIQALARQDALGQAAAAQVLGLLKQRSSALAEHRRTIPVMFRLALRARDVECAIQVLERANIVDEKLYVAERGDVAEQLASGAYASPLEHYLISGDAHDRSAFPLLRELSLAIRAEFSVEVPLVSLRAYLEVLAKSD